MEHQKAIYKYISLNAARKMVNLYGACQGEREEE